MEEQSLKTALQYFKCAFYEAYYKTRRQKKLVKREAEHLKHVLENSFNVIRPSKYRELERSSVKWIYYLKTYGLDHKESIKKFTTFVNKIRRLDERYEFGRDDEKRVEFKYHGMNDSIADESATDESEDENDDTENGSDEDSDDDHDNDRSNYGSGDNNDQEESHNEYENDDTENGSDEDSDDDDNSSTSESYSYAYSEDDFEDDNDDDNQNDIANMSDFDNSHLSTLENDDKDNFEKDDFENDNYDDEDNADDESADVDTDSQIQSNVVDTDSPTQSSNVDTDLPYQSTDGPKHFRQFNMSSCQELIDYRQSGLGALQPRLTGSCQPEQLIDPQQEVLSRLNNGQSTFSQFEENNSHEDKTKKMKRNSGVWSTQLTTATFEAQSAGLATHRQLSTKEDIADILIFENAKKQNKAPDKKRKAYIEEFYVFEKQHSCHWMQNLWKDRQSSCLGRQVCSVLVPRPRRKCWNPGIHVRDISAN